jgi:hypothetical protein
MQSWGLLPGVDHSPIGAANLRPCPSQITAAEVSATSPLCHPERTPDFLPRSTNQRHYAAFSKESRIRSIDTTKLDRKSGGGRGICSSADLSWKCFSTERSNRRFHFRAQANLQWGESPPDSVLIATVYGSGRVPHVRQSVHGPKMVYSNAFTRCTTRLSSTTVPGPHFRI